MNERSKTAIVTGASQGIGAGMVNAFVERGFNKDVMESRSPMGRPSTIKDITDAVLYLTEAASVTGHILYVDGGAHFGRW